MTKIFFRIIGLIVLLFLIILFVIPSIFYAWYLLTGKHIQRLSYSSAPTVAQTIVDKGLDAKECFNLKLNPFELIRYPTESQHQTGCISQVAFLRKDPTACELLMPSSYAWDCLGRARATRDACSVDYGKEVAWLDGPDVANDWKTASMSACVEGSVESEKGKDCCHILRLTSDPAINDCSRFREKKDLMNLCTSQLALKNADVTLCSAVTDENKRQICEVQAKYVK